jgi:hypothetical protein
MLTSISTSKTQFSILDEHLVEMRHVPHPSLGVSREVRLLNASPLQSTVLNRTVSYAALQAIGACQYCEVCQADLKRVPESHGGTAWERVSLSRCRCEPLIRQYVPSVCELREVTHQSSSR